MVAPGRNAGIAACNKRRVAYADGYQRLGKAVNVIAGHRSSYRPITQRYAAGRYFLFSFSNRWCCRACDGNRSVVRTVISISDVVPTQRCFFVEAIAEWSHKMK